LSLDLVFILGIIFVACGTYDAGFALLVIWLVAFAVQSITGRRGER
jgi:hypothetical protein